jgi:hypothetical protein
MCLPNAGLVVTLSLDFLDKFMEYNYVTVVFIIASQPRHMALNKVVLYFEIQCIKGLLPGQTCINLIPA